MEGFLHILSEFSPLATVWGDTSSSLTRIAPSPHHGLSVRIPWNTRAIPVPLLTVVSQSGEQTPPGTRRAIRRTVSEDSAPHVCQ